jgi:hypothetical protein
MHLETLEMFVSFLRRYATKISLQHAGFKSYRASKNRSLQKTGRCRQEGAVENRAL